MRNSFVFISLIASAGLYGQQVAPKPLPPLTVPPDTIVATVNGNKITAGEVQRMISAMPAKVQTAYSQDPKQFLREYSWYTHLVAIAEKNGLDQRSPYKEALDFQRMLTLVNAQLNEGMVAIEVTPEQQQKHYEANKGQYREAKAKLIYIPFSVGAAEASGSDKKVLSETEAKAKAESIAQQARSGADFVKLVKEHSQDSGSASQDGDMGMAIRPTTQQVPEPMRNVILTLKQGQVSDPIRHENGYYVFRAESSGVLPFEEVKDEIYKELKDVGFKQWQEKTKSEATIQFENEAFFDNAAKQQ